MPCETSLRSMLYTNMYAHIKNTYIYIYTHICMHVGGCVRCIYIHICMYIYIYTLCTYIYIHLHIYLSTYTYVRIYTYIYIYTHIYVFSLVQLPGAAGLGAPVPGLPTSLCGGSRTAGARAPQLGSKVDPMVRIGIQSQPRLMSYRP